MRSSFADNLFYLTGRSFQKVAPADPVCSRMATGSCLCLSPASFADRTPYLVCADYSAIREYAAEIWRVQPVPVKG